MQKIKIYRLRAPCWKGRDFTSLLHRNICWDHQVYRKGVKAVHRGVSLGVCHRVCHQSAANNEQGAGWSNLLLFTVNIIIVNKNLTQLLSPFRDEKWWIGSYTDSSVVLEVRVSPTAAQHHKDNKWVSFSVQNMITAWHDLIMRETFVEQRRGAAQYSRTVYTCGASTSDKVPSSATTQCQRCLLFY